MPPVDLDAVQAASVARRLTTAFRAHGHINNVLTHVASGRWDRIEVALAGLLSAEAPLLSPLSRNLLDLLWAEAGVTGRVVKPVFVSVCRSSLPPLLAERCMETIAIRAAGLE